ncbi:hypothetical protein BaRGS_00031823 [Batillaria attramentaria]|uniref:C1q domain-containing protein n=1 Tax=Batillaria attramentaria TaxID=370345 RepID=A0ABD0JQE2_9CAEN
MDHSNTINLCQKTPVVTMSRSFDTLILFILFLQTISTGAEVRGRRSDDNGPLELVVNGLTEKLTQLTAQVQAMASREAEINSLKSRLDIMEQPVAFTAKFRTSHVSGMGKEQTLTFDNVMYNAGGGYDPVSGHFTAPSSGTYAFFLTTMRYGSGTTVELTLNKGSTYLGTVYACCSIDATSSEAVTVHLSKGESVHVQMHGGSELYGDRYTTFSGMKISPN